MKKIKISCIEWLESIVLALSLIIILYTFFFRTFTVVGPSMDTTLADHDMLIVKCINTDIEYGKIVIIDSFTEDGRPLVKRVIAKEGDTVDIDNNTGKVILNGKVLEEEYAITPTLTRDGGTQFPLTVGEGKLLVLGDNRPVSKDSRSIDVGLIDERDVWGTVLARTAPLNKIGIL